jgi:hypothetical protein
VQPPASRARRLAERHLGAGDGRFAPGCSAPPLRTIQASPGSAGEARSDRPRAGAEFRCRVTEAAPVARSLLAVADAG